MDNEIKEVDELIPGTAQIRKIASHMTPMELLQLSSRLAEEGYEKKLFSVLSRVYTEHKGFEWKEEEGMQEALDKLIASGMPSELKMQTFTSFQIPISFRPQVDTAAEWVKNCGQRRLNIAAYFIDAYGYSADLADKIMGNKGLLKVFVAEASAESLLRLLEVVIDHEDKEVVTGLIRSVKNTRRKFQYTDKTVVKEVTEKAFASRQVFFTSKIMYCLAFSVPKEFLPPKKDLYKLLRISVNYDEKVTKEFVKRYHSDFHISDEALCRYFLGNKKAEKERPLVAKFASHVVQIEDETVRGKLLHMAFKRGGLFRMYAGCMQDGMVDEDKQKRFRYTDEQIEWVKTLPGLCADAGKNPEEE